MVTIAFTTQNRSHITSHAGRCRHFMVRRVDGGTVGEWETRTLGKEETLHAVAGLPPALQDVDVLITAGAGPGLQARMARHGVQLIVTDVLLPDQAIAAWMAGTLPVSEPACTSRRGQGGCSCGTSADDHSDH